MPSCILEVTNLALRDHAARRTYMVTQHYSDTRRDTRPDISLRHSQSGSNTRMSSTKTLRDASDIRDHDTTVNPPVATSATPPSDIRSTTATRTPIMNAVKGNLLTIRGIPPTLTMESTKYRALPKKNRLFFGCWWDRDTLKYKKKLNICIYIYTLLYRYTYVPGTPNSHVLMDVW